MEEGEVQRKCHVEQQLRWKWGRSSSQAMWRRLQNAATNRLAELYRTYDANTTAGLKTNKINTLA